MSRQSKDSLPKATDYQFVSALTKLVKAPRLPVNLEDAVQYCIDADWLRLPNLDDLMIVYERYACVMDFISPKFEKTALYDLLHSHPDNYFLIMDYYSQGKDALYIACNDTTPEECLSFTQDRLIIAYENVEKDDYKYLIKLNSFVKR